MKVCKIEGCAKPSLSRDLCNLHYLRLRKSGHLPLSTRYDKSIDLSHTPIATLAYMAGIIDGEGHVSAIGTGSTRRQYNPRISVGNTSLALIKWLELNFGGHIYTPSTVRDINRKLVYAWHSSKAPDIYEILSFINPYLVIKREQARLVMELCQITGTPGVRANLQTLPRRREIREELYLLHAVGSTTYQTETTAKKKTEIETITNDL